jgi:hypothetical protein
MSLTPSTCETLDSVEILEYGRNSLLSRRLVIMLIGLPLAAATVAGVLSTLFLRNDQQAGGLVSVTQVAGPATSTYDLAPYVADFQTAMKSPRTAKAVADELGVAPSSVGSRLTAAKLISDSTEVQVGLSAPTADAARRGLVAAARASLIALVDQQEVKARTKQDGAAAAVSAASTALNLFEARVGHYSVSEEFKQRQADLLALQNEAAGATSDPVRQRSLQDLVTVRRTELAAMGQIRLEAVQKQTALDQTTMTYNDAHTAADLAASLRTSLQTDEVMPTPYIVALGKQGAIVKSALAAAVAGFVVAMAVVAFSIRRRRSAEMRPAAPSPATRVWPRRKRTGRSRPRTGGRAADKDSDPAVVAGRPLEQSRHQHTG